MNPPVDVAGVNPGFVTTTSTAPAAAPAGATAVSVVELITVTDVAAVAPKRTPVPVPVPVSGSKKFVPLIVTDVPPASAPVFGVIVAIVGIRFTAAGVPIVPFQGVPTLAVPP